MVAFAGLVGTMHWDTEGAGRGLEAVLRTSSVQGSIN